MEGGDLERYYMAQAAKANAPYKPSWQNFSKWSMSVARALSFLHNCKLPVIHRDLKPMNLLLTAGLDLKVTDFGISKLMRPAATKTAPGAAHAKDAEGTPPMSGGVGTWRYMAPEVVRYEQYTDRVDIYSFALIMWFMYTGCQPFVAVFGQDAELVLKAYLRREPPRPDISKFPPAFGKFVQECWREDIKTRPSSYDCCQSLPDLHKEAANKKSSFGGFVSTLGRRTATP